MSNPPRRRNDTCPPRPAPTRHWTANPCQADATSGLAIRRGWPDVRPSPQQIPRQRPGQDRQPVGDQPVGEHGGHSRSAGHAKPDQHGNQSRLEGDPNHCRDAGRDRQAGAKPSRTGMPRCGCVDLPLDMSSFRHAPARTEPCPMEDWLAGGPLSDTEFDLINWCT